MPSAPTTPYTTNAPTVGKEDTTMTTTAFYESRFYAKYGRFIDRVKVGYLDFHPEDLDWWDRQRLYVVAGWLPPRFRRSIRQLCDLPWQARTGCVQDGSPWDPVRHFTRRMGSVHVSPHVSDE